MFRNRSVIEIMVIAFTAVIVGGFILFGGVVIVVEVVNPESDTDGAVDALSHAFATVLGALLGLLARGPIDTSDFGKRPKDPDEPDP